MLRNLNHVSMFAFHAIGLAIFRNFVKRRKTNAKPVMLFFGIMIILVTSISVSIAEITMLRTLECAQSIPLHRTHLISCFLINQAIQKQGSFLLVLLEEVVFNLPIISTLLGYLLVQQSLVLCQLRKCFRMVAIIAMTRSFL
uniref:Uncharacterized protein n=1 Tax=Cacopsylla melanoneura TaxID=428564 RepID=A0A8D8Z043_9HEMI